MKKNDVKDIQIKIRKMRKKSDIGNKGVGRGCRQSTVSSHSPPLQATVHAALSRLQAGRRRWRRWCGLLTQAIYNWRSVWLALTFLRY